MEIKIDIHEAKRIAEKATYIEELCERLGAAYAVNDPIYFSEVYMALRNEIDGFNNYLHGKFVLIDTEPDFGAGD